MERRNNERVKKSLLVNISRNGFEGMGVTANVSRGGMLVATTEKLPEQSEVLLLVGINDETFQIRGEVVWCRNSYEGPGDATCGSGVRITDAPEGYLDYVEKVLENVL